MKGFVQQDLYLLQFVVRGIHHEGKQIQVIL